MSKSWFAALAALTVMLGAPLSAWSEDVFLVASYHQKDACGEPQYNAALDALKQGGLSKLSSRGYFLDARVSSKDDVQKMIAQIKQDIRTVKPKLVFTLDDVAFAMLYEDVLQQPGTQLVFSGLNRRLDFYNDKARFLNGRTPVANITGVFEKLFMRDQLSLVETVLKRPLNKVAVLYSTDAIGVILKD